MGYWRVPQLSPDHPPSSFQVWKRLAYQMASMVPEGGCSIVAATMDVGNQVKEIIAEMRGPVVAAQCRIYSVNRHDQIAKLSGLRGCVLIDASIAQHAKPDLWLAVFKVVEDIRCTSSGDVGRTLGPVA